MIRCTCGCEAPGRDPYWRRTTRAAAIRSAERAGDARRAWAAEMDAAYRVKHPEAATPAVDGDREVG